MDSHSVHWPCLVEGLQGKTVKAVSSAATHTIALDTTGRVTTFGKQTYGRLGRRDADVESGEPMEAGPVDNLDDVPVTGVVAGENTRMNILQTRRGKTTCPIANSHRPSPALQHHRYLHHILQSCNSCGWVLVITLCRGKYQTLFSMDSILLENVILDIDNTLHL